MYSINNSRESRNKSSPFQLYMFSSYTTVLLFKDIWMLDVEVDFHALCIEM